MPKLYSSRQILKILTKHGFIPVSQRGSHLKLETQVGSKKLTVIVPANRQEIPQGTFRSILRQSGLSEKDFKNN
ncbi:MAG: type II toxin-antitoxin system HicA family toxin [Candidatus Vogelbacteria bacterium]|nr:type II toxin-antitoxin system HicA family toxin [Candidatus Vogelbacteria bacterium]